MPDLYGLRTHPSKSPSVATTKTSSSPVRLGSLLQLVEAEMATREVNDISFVERGIDTFLSEGPAATESVFVTTATRNQIQHAPPFYKQKHSSGILTIPPQHETLNSTPFPHASLYATLLTPHTHLASHQLHSSAQYGTYDDDEDLFLCSSSPIPTYSVSDFKTTDSDKTNPYSSHTFQGFRLDCGASRSAIDRDHYHEYLNFNNIYIPTKPIRARLIFADAKYIATSSFIVRLPTLSGDSVFIDTAIIDAKIPLLLDIDAMINHGLDLLYYRQILTPGTQT